MTAEAFQQIAPTLPQEPGIYKYYDVNGNLLYVGKAKNIRKRVSSYFTKNDHSYKTHELVRRIRRIEFTIVGTEHDAFLLENSLIKQFQPLFNINLKDDKAYPWIVIKNEPFPRVFLTRQRIEDGSQYFGPYTSVGRVRDLLNFIKQTIPLRTCPLNLAPRNIEKGKFKVCLEFHLGNCKGPCEARQSMEDYDENIAQIKNLLKGHLSPVFQHFKKEMKAHVEALEFEKAEAVHKKIRFLEQYQSRSVVINNSVDGLDVFSIQKDGDIAYVNYLMLENGTIVQTKTLPVEARLDEAVEEILAFTIGQLRHTFQSSAREIVTPFPIEYDEPGIQITVPKGGEKKKLLELSEKNVQYFVNEQRSKERLNVGNKKIKPVLEQIRTDLTLSEVPVHIECFDNSHFHGSYPVSAMVCFRNGEPSRKDYRIFNLKTTEGKNNDFASMKEGVYRRYRRLINEGEDLPQLVIIDGGKGQLGAAHEAIEELGLQGRMTLVGLAKNEEELFFVGDKESLKLPYNSDSLLLIRRIRDEVHNHGVSSHRNKRSKGTFKNELEDIKGIGAQTAQTLLKTFRSVAGVRRQSLEELSKVIGIGKAKIVQAYFNQADEEEESIPGPLSPGGGT